MGVNGKYQGIGAFLTDTEVGRRQLLQEGMELGSNTARTDYPHAVYRDRRQVEQQAAQLFQIKSGNWKLGSELNLREAEENNLKYWKDRVWEVRTKLSHPLKGKNPKDLYAQFLSKEQAEVARWDAQIDEARRLFVSAYASAYLEYVQKEDVRRAPPPPQPTPQPQPKPQPQPTPQPATPSNTATYQGAKITLKDVDRKANEYVYYLELTDSENFDGIEKTEWVVYFEGATVPTTEAATTTAAYGQTSSNSGNAYGSSTPQKTARKPKGSYLRRPQ